MTSPLCSRFERGLLVSVFATMTMLGLSSDARAQGAPDSLTFQGLLTDDAGEALSAAVQMTFRLYEDNTVVWTETHAVVDVKNGIFNVLLGNTTPLDTVDFDQPMDIGITVGGDPEIAPRTPLGASPFALAVRGMHAVWVENVANTRSYNLIGGAPNNTVGPLAIGATIGGGGGHSFGAPAPNTIAEEFGTIGGGRGNTVDGARGTIGGGVSNTAGGNDATVAGGSENSALALRSTVGGGESNLASGESATVSGGFDNEAISSGATVGGGDSNNAGAAATTVGGGSTNSATASYATIGGGDQNQASGENSTVGGGSDNLAGADNATVGGGFFNEATGEDATISGGSDNIAGGVGATVPGGLNNRAMGQHSFAAGKNAKADHGGTFVWADTTAGEFASTGGNQFLIRATGGVGIGRNDPAHPLHMASGAHVTAAGVWTSVSSRAAKYGLEDVDNGEILDRLAALPVTKWRYLGEDGALHIGPMAEDFRGAFGLGHDDRYITTVDADGIALAAIQGLYEIVKRQQAEIDALKKPRQSTWLAPDER